MDELFPFDPEDPKHLNQGIWECEKVLPNVIHLTVIIRVSTDKLDQNSSIANQMEIARDFAYLYGYQVVRIIIVRESGLKVEGNPIFKEFMRIVSRGAIGFIYMTELSRLTRRAKDMLVYIPEFYKSGIRVVSEDDEFDTSNDKWYGKLIELSRKYEAESVKISVRQKRAYRARANRKEYLGTQAPYGLDKVDKKGLTIAVDGSAETVREIFYLAVMGKNPNEVARILTERKVITPSQRLGRRNAGIRWHDTEVRKILTNPVYCGHFQGPQSHVILVGETKRKMVPKSEIVLNKDQMEQLIDQETFDTVQKILLSRTKGKDGRAIYQDHKDDPLIDILYCGDCGKQMHRVPRPWGKEQYACSTHLKKGKGSCTGRHSIYRSSLYQAVLEDIQLLLRDLDMKKLIDHISQKSTLKRMLLQKEIRKIRTKTDFAENAILDIELAKIQNRITDEVANQLVGRKKSEIETLKEVKQRYEESIRLLIDIETSEFVSLSLKRIESNALIRTLVNKIEVDVDGEISRIVYNISTDSCMHNMAA